MHVYLVSDYYHRSTSVRHINHLFSLLPNRLRFRKTLIILADNGPDWSTEVQANLLNYGRLWRDLKLDRLVIIHYSPGCSKYNFIERCWGRFRHIYNVYSR